MTVNPFKVVISVVLWLLLMGFLASFYWWQWLHADHQIPKMHSIFVVENGESLKSVAARLYNIDLIRWPSVWVLYARFQDPDSIKAGEYQFNKIESPIGILDRLQSDKVITYSVTLIEGKTFTEYIQVLDQQEKLVSKLTALPLEQQLKVLGVDHQEGWFYPETYQFVAGDTDVKILRRAYDKMKLSLDAEWEARASGLPYASAYEALIMASIIEKETGAAVERPEIAGVFVRRLKKGMRLQTDPTVIYGVEGYSGNLTRAHLKTHTPYNTYMIPGLPPTPIAMPGGASIHAALNPAPGKSLYFVAKGDGSHYFSETLEEHNKAVTKYQRKRRAKNYRSSPSAPQ